MKKVILIVLLWIVIVNVFAFVVLNRFNLNPDTAYKWITPQSFPTAQSWNVVQMHNRWDSYWYLDIVKNGYYLRTDNTLSNVAFFPLYPTLIKIFGTVLLGNFVLAGWLLSTAFLFLAMIYFYKLVKEFHSDTDPYLPIIFTLIFPTAFFLNIVYTEAMFLFLTLACFYYVFKKEFWLAGLIAFFGALTHSNGIFLALPILWETWRLHGWKSTFTPTPKKCNYGPADNQKKYRKITSLVWGFTPKIIPVILPGIATAGFFAFSAWKFNDLFLFFKLESAWGRSFSINWDHFIFFSHPAIINFAIDAFFTVLIITIIFLVGKKLSWLYAIFMSLTVLSALTSGTLMSIGRYSLVLFPMFILIAKMKDKTYLMAWALASILFLALDITLFVNNYWAG